MRVYSFGVLLFLFITSQTAPALIIDHTCTDLNQVPDSWIEQAKSQFRVFYAHTSHGSQIVTGMDNLKGSAGSTYWWDYDGTSGGLSLHDYYGEYGDLGHNGDLTWRDHTVSILDGTGNDRNMVMWSWCGGMSDNTYAGVQAYLNAMNQLETQYPEVTFIYMTGHLDGTGESGTLHARNNQIRDYCRNNNKVLFDFADIESYDPSGNYFLDRGADDECYYDGRTRNWATEWCAVNSGSALCACTYCDCAHSEPVNCNMKGRAFWWMLARLAGWSGSGGGTDPDPGEQFSSSPTAPSGDVAGRQPPFSWTEASGATWYRIWIHRNRAWYWDLWVQDATSWTTASWSFDIGAYQWWVQPWGPGNGYGVWSSGMSFDVGVASPLEPAGNISSTDPSFRWNEVSGVSWYWLWINRDGSWYWDTWVQGAASWSSPSWPFDEGDYEWWVQTWDASGYGPWSGGMTFTIGSGSGSGSGASVPTAVSPTGTISFSRPTFSWSAVSGAEAYEVEIRSSSGWNHAEGTCEPSWTIPDWDLDVGEYTWHVRVYAGGSYGDWSNELSFTVE